MGEARAAAGDCASGMAPVNPRTADERAVRLTALHMRIVREQIVLVRGLATTHPEHLSATALLAFAAEVEEVAGEIRQMIPAMRNDLPPVVVGRLDELSDPGQ